MKLKGQWRGVYFPPPQMSISVFRWVSMKAIGNRMIWLDINALRVLNRQEQQVF
jgi:hypothetical protein